MFATIVLAASAVALSPQSADAQISHSTENSSYETDIGCLAVVTSAQGLLRRGDPRQQDAAVALPTLQARIDAYLSDGNHDSAQVILDLQAAVNASRADYLTRLPDCVAREKSITATPPST